jgi:hypothetical protein
MFWDVAKELWPTIKDALKDGIGAAMRSRRRRRHLLVLKAMGSFRGAPASIEEIDHNLRIFQMEDAKAKDMSADLILDGGVHPEKEKAYRKRLVQQTRLGLPGLDASDRLARLEDILQEMYEHGKLSFLPPDYYAVLRKKS